MINLNPFAAWRRARARRRAEQDALGRAGRAAGLGVRPDQVVFHLGRQTMPDRPRRRTR
jgi:hypothetical protein